MDSGTFLIGHPTNTDGKFMSLAESKRKYPAITKTNKEVLRVLKEYQKAQKTVLINCTKHINQEHGFALKREIKLFSP